MYVINMQSFVSGKLHNLGEAGIVVSAKGMPFEFIWISYLTVNDFVLFLRRNV